MPAGERSIEADKIAESKLIYKEYADLPLVSTGCDSYASWHPKFKDLSPFIKIDHLANDLVDLLPNKQWRDEHLVITGGEPLLGWQKLFPELLTHVRMMDLKELTFETNGTQKLSDDFQTFLESWTSDRSYDALTFSVSPKLSCSGEPRSVAIQPDVINQYQQVGHTYLKFVVATENDVAEALEVIKLYKAGGFKGVTYLMPVGGTTETYYLNNTAVANLALKHGLRYSPRLQVDLYKNQWGT